MKYCEKCGNELMDEAVICPKCGCVTGELPNSTADTRAPQGNGMAVAGFVCSFFIPLLGWIFGGIGLGKAAKLGGKGRGLSIAALIIATVLFFISLYVQLR